MNFKEFYESISPFPLAVHLDLDPGGDTRLSFEINNEKYHTNPLGVVMLEDRLREALEAIIAISPAEIRTDFGTVRLTNPMKIFHELKSGNDLLLNAEQFQAIKSMFHNVKASDQPEMF